MITISIILAVFIYGCREKGDASEEMYNINLAEGYTDTTLHLEDFARDVRIVRLETNKKSLISYLRGHIGEKHIVVMGRENMLHFSADDGSYIGKITQKGKGPHEFNYVETWEVDENGQWIRKNAIKYYTCVRATNEYLYALCQYEHSHDLSGSNPTLEIWDWKGNPIAFLKMDQSICSFDVTVDNSIIYATSFNDMDKIFVYETDQIMP